MPQIVTISETSQRRLRDISERARGRPPARRRALLLGLFVLGGLLVLGRLVGLGAFLRVRLVGRALCRGFLFLRGLLLAGLVLPLEPVLACLGGLFALVRGLARCLFLARILGLRRGCWRCRRCRSRRR